MTAKRVDSNQKEIVKIFRDLGANVLILSDVGKGCPDICVGWSSSNGQRLNFLVEIKDGSKPPSSQRLTESEQKFHDNWKGQVCIIRSVDEAIALINRVR